jgi:hypothetical protein
MPVGFDTTILSALLNPSGRLPNDPATGQPVDLAKERISGLISRLQKDKERIIIPAPCVAELLSVIGPTNSEYLQIINRSRVFEVRAFDELAAFELAFINRDVLGKEDAKNRLEPRQKVKFDRQILAVWRVAGCEVIHTDDSGMIASAEKCGLKALRIADLPIPDDAKQGKLALEQHEPLPEPEDENDDNGEG